MVPQFSLPLHLCDVACGSYLNIVLLHCVEVYDHLLTGSFLELCNLSIAGNAILEKSDLEPALKALKDRLMTKNVVCNDLFVNFLHKSAFQAFS